MTEIVNYNDGEIEALPAELASVFAPSQHE
jgi:hypothetical protein